MALARMYRQTHTCNELWEVLKCGNTNMDWDINMELTLAVEMDKMRRRKLVQMLTPGLNLD
jgi:hypothetical protein